MAPVPMRFSAVSSVKPASGDRSVMPGLSSRERTCRFFSCPRSWISASVSPWSASFSSVSAVLYACPPIVTLGASASVMELPPSPPELPPPPMAMPMPIATTTTAAKPAISPGLTFFFSGAEEAVFPPETGTSTTCWDSMASRNSAADWNRSSGWTARPFRIALSKYSGMSMPHCETGTRSSCSRRSNASGGRKPVRAA